MSPLSNQSPFTFRTILIYAIIIVVAVIFVAYVLFQARFLLAGPQIFVQQIPATQSERLIELEGQARNIVRITLNGRQIYTDKAGYFKEALVLENGYTIATLEAEDRYGRKTSRTESFVYIDTQEKNDEGIN
jgi:hypothetical protein